MYLGCLEMHLGCLDLLWGAWICFGVSGFVLWCLDLFVLGLGLLVLCLDLFWGVCVLLGCDYVVRVS